MITIIFILAITLLTREKILHINYDNKVIEIKIDLNFTEQMEVPKLIDN